MTQTIFSGTVAGVSHAKPDFDLLSAEDEVFLFAEPQNEFDRHAIRVEHQSAGKLGYIPREATVCIRDAVRNGFDPLARIVSFDDTGKWLKVTITVTIEL